MSSHSLRNDPKRAPARAMLRGAGLTDEDLELMSAYILVAPKVLGPEWGGGKIYF